VVSVGGFAVWAFGGKWFGAHAGEAGMYVAITIVFLGLAGLLMQPLMRGPKRGWQFLSVFTPAFLGYAFAWSACWFWLHFGWGEWLGSLAGSLAFTLIAARRFGYRRTPIPAALVFFAAHSLGYFIGGKMMQLLAGPVGAELFENLPKTQLGTVAKLSWGLCYGLGFGAGMGYVFHLFQKPPNE
jgi:hypothetical protein